MKRKMFVVVLLVVVCLGMLVVEGVSQPPEPVIPPSGGPAPTSVPLTPASPTQPPLVAGSYATPNFSTDQPQQQEQTFEQLVEALKGVRARQRELKAQEADLLAKMAKKVEEKRQDLSKSEATLRQLGSENGRIHPVTHIGDKKGG